MCNFVGTSDWNTTRQRGLSATGGKGVFQHIQKEKTQSQKWDSKSEGKVERRSNDIQLIPTLSTNNQDKDIKASIFYSFWLFEHNFQLSTPHEWELSKASSTGSSYFLLSTNFCLKCHRFRMRKEKEL